MRRHPVAGTYATALLALGQESGEAETYEAELAALEQIFAESEEARVFFENPKVPHSEKLAVLDKVLTGRVSDVVRNLMKVLVKRGRQEIFDQICLSYKEAFDDARGRTSVLFTTATPLAPNLRSELVTLMAAKLQREIIASERVEEHLLGGMTIRIGDTVIDGSVRSKLNKVREALAAPRLGSELFDED